MNTEDQPITPESLAEDYLIRNFGIDYKTKILSTMACTGFLAGYQANADRNAGIAQARDLAEEALRRHGFELRSVGDVLTWVPTRDKGGQVCEVCRWTNTGCLKVQGRWTCHGCIDRGLAEIASLKTAAAETKFFQPAIEAIKKYHYDPAFIVGDYAATEALFDGTFEWADGLEDAVKWLKSERDALQTAAADCAKAAEASAALVEKLTQEKNNLVRQFRETVLACSPYAPQVTFADHLREYVTACLDCVVRERDELAGWKSSQMKVESQWDSQAVAKALELRAGQDVRPAILPAILMLRSALSNALKERDALSEAARNALKSMTLPERDAARLAASNAETEMETQRVPHNPDNLTPEQVGMQDGWRLLDEDELIQYSPSDLSAPADGLIEGRLSIGGWYPMISSARTYRTKLTREELRKARVLEPLHKCGTCGSTDPTHVCSDEMQATIERLTAERDAARKAREWVDRCGMDQQVWDAAMDRLGEVLFECDQLRAELSAAREWQDRVCKFALCGPDDVINKVAGLAVDVGAWKHDALAVREELSTAKERLLAYELVKDLPRITDLRKQEALERQLNATVEALSAANAAREKALAALDDEREDRTRLNRALESYEMSMDPYLEACAERDSLKAERDQLRLAATLNESELMAEDAAKKGEVARLNAGALEEGVKELRRQLAETTNLNLRIDQERDEIGLQARRFEKQLAEAQASQNGSLMKASDIVKLQRELAEWQAVAGKKDAALKAFEFPALGLIDVMKSEQPVGITVLVGEIKQARAAIQSDPPTALLDELQRAWKESHARLAPLSEIPPATVHEAWLASETRARHLGATEVGA